MLPDYFGTMLAAIALVGLLGGLMMFIAWRVIDKITPGKLDDEIVPADKTKQPNQALAIVVGFMFLSWSVVLGFAIHGVLTH